VFEFGERGVPKQKPVATFIGLKQGMYSILYIMDQVVQVMLECCTCTPFSSLGTLEVKREQHEVKLRANNAEFVEGVQ
jgi:hypothetical protein